MAKSEIHQNDAGVDFRIAIEDDDGVVDLSASSVRRYMFQKPDGSMLVVNASFFSDGTDGLLTYSSQPDDFDQVGNWKYQVYVEIGPDKKYSDIGKFKVYPNLPLEI